MSRAFPVDALLRAIFFPETREDFFEDAIVDAAFGTGFACLTDAHAYNPLTPNNLLSRYPVITAVHRFQELIAGHPYQIEVCAVEKDRWRAYIVRIPGVPTALMPFYGPTPDEAANRLRTWLTRAHERAAAQS